MTRSNFLPALWDEEEGQGIAMTVRFNFLLISTPLKKQPDKFVFKICIRIPNSPQTFEGSREDKSKCANTECLNP